MLLVFSESLEGVVVVYVTSLGFQSDMWRFFGNIERITVLVVFRFSSDKIILNTNKEAHYIFIAVTFSSLLYTLAGLKSGNIDQFCFLLIASFLTNETLKPVYLIFV